VFNLHNVVIETITIVEVAVVIVVAEVIGTTTTLVKVLIQAVVTDGVAPEVDFKVEAMVVVVVAISSETMMTAVDRFVVVHIAALVMVLEVHQTMHHIKNED
jgi:hypothetical protein